MMNTMYQLRDYQSQALQAIRDKFQRHKSTLVEMATGTGKTVLFAHLARDWSNGRVMVIAHRKELIEQNADKISKVIDAPVGIEMGQSHSHDTFKKPNVVVGSIQTLCRTRRRIKFNPDEFGLLVIDEGHHATALTYQETIKYFHAAKSLLVSATPKRADGVGLGQICESIAFQYGLQRAIEDGYLVPVAQRVVRVQGLDFSQVKKSHGDLKLDEVEKIIVEEKILQNMCSSAHEIIGDRPTIWFCAGVNQAQRAAEILSRYVPADTVAFLSGKTPKDEREYYVKKFRDGTIRHLFNCALFLEGFDAPNTAAIVMGRPTTSTSLYMQMLGRGTRPQAGLIENLDSPDERRARIAQSFKPDVLVIDYAGNAGRHQIISAIDVLAGDAPLPVREYAKKLSPGASSQTIASLLARAKAEMALSHEEALRRRGIVGKASYCQIEIDPFSGKRIETRNQMTRGDCSVSQANYIVYLSSLAGKVQWTMDQALSLSRGRAGKIIGNLKAQAGIP